MNNNKIFDDITRTITHLIPESLTGLQHDLEANIRAALELGLSRMNLVTREEFDVQTALLQRSREKLEQLEQQLAELSAQQQSGRKAGD